VYSHWGIPPHWHDTDGPRAWIAEVRRFGKAIWDIVCERRNPTIVFDHHV
jgi:crotonyl-CoA carboxylase/reductase